MLVVALVAMLNTIPVAALVVMLIVMQVAMLVPVCEVVLLLLPAQQENSLQAEEQTEEQRQLNKIFLQDSDCKSDNIISPIDKHETQRSSVGGTHTVHVWVLGWLVAVWSSRKFLFPG